jgi:cysteine desulfurase/selenocysteine lyase
LYVHGRLLETLEPPMLDMFAAEWVAPDRFEVRPDARRFENWENNYAARLGLGVAVDYALDLGLAEIWERIQKLAETLRDGLSFIPDVKVRDIGRVQCGIVTFTLEGVDALDIKAALAARRINVSVSNPSSTLLDASRRNLPPVVRASVHYYNDDAEIAQLLEAVTILSTKKG